MVDPFPDIPPALLNSADIEAYALRTGMIEPFCAKDLKSASYGARVGNRAVLWTDAGVKKESLLQWGSDPFELPPNAIAFIEIGTQFRLPPYIAARFNLKISNAYRGLLVGTGPLIDPGFEGKINLPLHNLTGNSYWFNFNEEIIWLEFTKVSPNAMWYNPSASTANIRPGGYRSFPDHKKNLKLHQYLWKATKGRPILSSIPAAIGDFKEQTQRAQKEAESAKNSASSIQRWTMVALAVTVLLGIAPLVVTTLRLHSAYTTDFQDIRMHVKDLREQIGRLNTESSMQAVDDSAALAAPGEASRDQSFANSGDELSAPREVGTDEDLPSPEGQQRD